MGFCTAEENPFGPFQLQDVTAPVADPERFSALPVQMKGEEACAAALNGAAFTATETEADALPQLFVAVTV